MGGQQESDRRLVSPRLKALAAAKFHAQIQPSVAVGPEVVLAFSAMFSQAQTSAASLARKARIFILGILLMGLLGAACLGYRVHQLSAATSDYLTAYELRVERTVAISNLRDMQTRFHEFLQDGSSLRASLTLSLMQKDRQSIELVTQGYAELRDDKLLQSLVAKERAWYAQATPLIEQRKTLPAGVGPSEDSLPDLDVASFELAAERDYSRSLEGLAESQQTGLRLFFEWLVAALLLALPVLFAAGASKRVGALQGAAANGV